MSDGTVRVVVGGRRYRVPADAVDKMKADGVAFELADAGPAPAQGGGALEAIGDGARGALHGATWGVSDAIAEGLGAEPYEKVVERSPTATTIGDVGGAILSPIGNKVGGVVKGAGKLAIAGRAALQGAAEGGVRELAEGGDLGDAALAAGGGGLLGGSVAGTIAGVGGKVANSVRGAGEWLGTQADKARLVAKGVTGADLQGLAKRLGVAAIPKELAAKIEEIIPSPRWGESAGEAADRLGVQDAQGNWVGGQLKDVGDQLRGAYRQAGDEGANDLVPGAWQKIQERLSRMGADAKAGSPQERGYRTALKESALGVGQELPPEDVLGLVGRKSAWQAEGHAGNAGAVPDRASAQVAADQGRVAKEELDAILRDAAPETMESIGGLRQQYGDRAMLQKIAAKRGASEAVGFNPLPGIAGGMAAGFAGGMVGGPAGAVAGLAGGLASGSANQIVQAFRTPRGQDALANLARTLEQRAPGAAGRIDGVTAGAADSRAVRNLPALIGSGLVVDDGDEEEQRRRALGYGSTR